MEHLNAPVVALILQAGFAGICILLILIGSRERKDSVAFIGAKLDRLEETLMILALRITDHKAREGDTPPARFKER